MGHSGDSGRANVAKFVNRPEPAGLFLHGTSNVQLRTFNFERRRLAVSEGWKGGRVEGGRWKFFSQIPLRYCVVASGYAAELFLIVQKMLTNMQKASSAFRQASYLVAGFTLGAVSGLV